MSKKRKPKKKEKTPHWVKTVMPMEEPKEEPEPEMEMIPEEKPETMTIEPDWALGQVKIDVPSTVTIQKPKEETPQPPASDTALPSPMQSSPEFPKIPEESDLAKKIKEYISEHSVALLLKGLCEGVPEAMPNYTTWKFPFDSIEVIRLITVHLRTPGYIDLLISTLRCMMGDNVNNISWSARVAIAITVYHLVVVWSEGGE